MTEEEKRASTKNLEKIKNIVIVMLENRSFDSMLGWLYEKEAPPRGQEFDGLREDMWNPLDNIDANGIPFVEKVPIHKNGTSTWKFGKEIKHPVDFSLPNPDPGEGYKDTNHQLFQHYNVAREYPVGPTNFGFVNNYKNAMLYGTYSFGDKPTDPREIMTTYTPEQLPVLSTLAKKYAVSDRWFCSVPSQTLPNRDFIHAASSDGFVNNRPNAICDKKTIYNQIQEAIENGRDDLSWKVYGSNPLNKNDRSYKSNEVGHEENKDYFSLTRVIMSQLHPAKFDKNFETLNDFYEDCKEGNLPRYSFIEPIFHGEDQNDQHPPSDVRAGDRLLGNIYNHLADSPQWNDTLLVITYDEHGGCFDHVAPPSAVPPEKEPKPGQDGFLFNRLGVRVPAVLVSPYIPENTVCRPGKYGHFDHTSVIATARELFDLKESLTERDKAAHHLGVALQLDEPRADKVKLHPLAYEKIDVGTHDLHRLMEESLSKITGIYRKENEDIIPFIYKTYHTQFYGAHKENRVDDKIEIASASGIISQN